MSAKIDITFLAGEILRDFIEGAGLYVSIAGFLMILAILRRPPAREVRREYL